MYCVVVYLAESIQLKVVGNVIEVVFLPQVPAVKKQIVGLGLGVAQPRARPRIRPVAVVF